MFDLALIIKLATTFFIVTNPIGNSPAILTLVQGFSETRQRMILFREGLFALLLALFFQYLGEQFLGTLHLTNYTVAYCGGILLFLVALQLIFPKHNKDERAALQREPYVVPIATPLLAGPGLFAIIMISSQEVPAMTMSVSLIVCWIGVWAVLLVAPWLQRILGRKGMLALEQVMGMVLAFISIELLVKGTRQFLDVCTK